MKADALGDLDHCREARAGSTGLVSCRAFPGQDHRRAGGAVVPAVGMLCGLGGSVGHRALNAGPRGNAVGHDACRRRGTSEGPQTKKPLSGRDPGRCGHAASPMRRRGRRAGLRLRRRALCTDAQQPRCRRRRRGPPPRAGSPRIRHLRQGHRVPPGMSGRSRRPIAATARLDPACRCAAGQETEVKPLGASPANASSSRSVRSGSSRRRTSA